MSTLAIDQATASGCHTPNTVIIGEWTGATTAVPITGEWTGTTPTGIQASVDGGSYASCTSFAQPGSGGAGTFDCVLPAYAAGVYSLTIRMTNETATTKNVSLQIGDVIGVIGDSTVNSADAFDAGLNFSDTPNCVVFRKSDTEWSNLLNTTNDSFWPYFALQWRALTARPLALINWGVSGSRLSIDWNPAEGPPNSYHEFVDEITDTLLPSGVTAVLAMMDVNDWRFRTGEILQSTFYGYIVDLSESLTADLPGSPVVLKSILGDGVSNADAPIDFSGVSWRAMILANEQAYENGDIYRGANLTGLFYTDGVHPDTQALGQVCAERWFAPLKVVLGGGTVNAPRLSRVTFVDDQTIHVQFNAEVDPGLSTDVHGFRVNDDGVLVDPDTIAVQRTGSQQFSIALDNPILGTCTASFAYNDDAVGETNLPRSIAVALPDTTQGHSSMFIVAEPFYDEIALPPAEGRFLVVRASQA